MNSSQKGKAFERWDRDGVAQHRNMMHEIAMQKQLSMYQREEKILEKELREISKVKETLLQIRAPLRRRVQATYLEDNSVKSTGVERNSGKVSVSSTKTSEASSGDQQSCTNKLDSDGTNGLKLQTSSTRTSLQTKHEVSKSSANTRQHKISVLELPRQNTPPGISGGKGFAEGKISAPAFYSGTRPFCEDSGKSGFLPIIKTPESPPEFSPSVKRKSPLLDRPLSASKDTEVVCNTRSPSKLSPIAPSRADMTISRARSVPCDLPSHPITPRGRRAKSEADEVATLTMEETLRIKGKFRQIGHSVIATALLKGLKQKGQLSSEAIHNMHKPISLGEGKVAKNEENKGGDESTSSESKGNDGDEKPSTQGQRKVTFRNVARKTINVNRMLSLRNNIKRRSQSDPSQIKNSSENAVGYSKDKRDNSTQSIDFGTNGAKIAEQQRRISTTEIQEDNNSQKESESENTSQTQQISGKQSASVDPFRPLMNPRTAHARRRKNTLTGEFIQSPSLDFESQQTQLDDKTMGNKSVRFASDAWT